MNKQNDGVPVRVIHTKDELGNDLMAIEIIKDQHDEPHIMKEILFEDAMEFAEWVGKSFIRLEKVWVHRYLNQHDKSNWMTTQQLYILWREGNGYRKLKEDQK